MADRITIMMDSKLSAKVREFQAKKIQKENTSYSFSKALEHFVRKGLAK